MGNFLAQMTELVESLLPKGGKYVETLTETENLLVCGRTCILVSC